MEEYKKEIELLSNGLQDIVIYNDDEYGDSVLLGDIIQKRLIEKIAALIIQSGYVPNKDDRIKALEEEIRRGNAAFADIVREKTGLQKEREKLRARNTCLEVDNAFLQNKIALSKNIEEYIDLLKRGVDQNE